MREEMRSHRQLAELAKTQHGVVSSRQLTGLGYSTSAIGRALRAGRLHRLHRGVYAVGHTTTTPNGRFMAAVLTCGPDALLSHTSAAWLWGLAPHRGELVHVSVPRAGHRRNGINAHHAPALRDRDRALIERIPVTAVPRTLLDFASIRTRRDLERTIERCEQRGLFDLDGIDELLARTAGHPGAGRLRDAVAAYHEPAFTRSELERRFLELVRRARLPIPSVNFFIAGYELDMYWPHEQFAVELDGYEHHRTRAAFERDRVRQEDLMLAGIEMTRLSDRRLRKEAEAVAERLRQLLTRRRHELGRAP